MKKINYLLLLLFIGTCSISNAQQNLTYKGFLDINAEITNGHKGFNFGGFDNYLSSQITDKLTFVGEIIVQPYQDQEFRVDVERIHATYEFNDYLKVKIGRFYAPIGFYTTHFFSDHSATLTPSISRPVILAYEDDGGILETRATGIMVSGSNITRLKLAYDVSISNGTGSNSLDDNDNNKALTMRLSMNPVEGLTFGGGARFDKLDSAAISHGTEEAVGEQIQNRNYSGFASYKNKNILLMGEYYTITNKSAEAGTHKSFGAFAYAGYTIKGKLSPYIQYDYLNVSENDIYYTSANNEKGFDLGLKYAFNFQSVIKAEYHVDAKALLLQYAIGF